MAAKAYVSGNFFIFDSNNDGFERRDFKATVMIYPKDNTNEVFIIDGPHFNREEVLMADLIDENGDAYTLANWQKFISRELGLEKNEDWLERVSRGLVPGASVIHKFGAGTINTTLRPIATANTYKTPQANAAVSLEVVGGVNDTAAGSGAREVTLVGIGPDGMEKTEVVATSGASPAAVSGTWIRLYRKWVSASGTYADDTTPSHTTQIDVQEAGGGDVWGTIAVDGGFGLGQSQIGCYTVAINKVAYILSTTFAVDSTKAISMYFFKRDGILKTAPPYDAMRVNNTYVGLSGVGEFVHRTNEKFGPGSDIGFMGKTSSGTANASIEFELLIIDI